ncbi:glycosyl hydrolase [Lipomyces doorenjongii]
MIPTVLYTTMGFIIYSTSTTQWYQVGLHIVGACDLDRYQPLSYCPHNLQRPSHSRRVAVPVDPFSNDNGLTWTKYNGNPVIPSPPPEYADQYNEFRDPFVFWHSPSSKWIMVATLAMEQTLLIYSSDNLKDWTLESQSGPYNARFGEWECPSSALCGR